MKNIAIITARGGSKRIPKKNIKEFCGRPIIAYSIRAAIESEAFDEVMVSTDSEEIAEIARSFGAKVPFLRSEKTSDDFATTSDVIKEVIEEYGKIGQNFDCICCIYPTAPFVTREKLSAAIGMVEVSNVDGVIPVVRFSFPPQRAFVVREGKLMYKYPEYALERSQDLEPQYHDCGQFYICKTEAFLRCGSMVADNVMPLIIPEEEVQDIDTISDWNIAEIKFKTFIGK